MLYEILSQKRKKGKKQKRKRKTRRKGKKKRQTDRQTFGDLKSKAVLKTYLI